MYRKILVALENSKADEALIPHIMELAGRLKSEIFLVHVADGWVARNYDRLKLVESEEMKADRDFLEKVAGRMRSAGLQVKAQLALGDPSSEILKCADSENCDLIAMTSHGHRIFGDVFFGSVIREVRHRTTIPVLLVRAGQK